MDDIVPLPCRLHPPRPLTRPPCPHSPHRLPPLPLPPPPPPLRRLPRPFGGNSFFVCLFIFLFVLVDFISYLFVYLFICLFFYFFISF